MNNYKIPRLPLPYDFETKEILRQVNPPSDYYKLIQDVRDGDGDNSKQWEEWILFMLQKTKIGKSNYYINENLVDLFLNVGKRV